MKRIKRNTKWLCPGFLKHRERELRFTAKSDGTLFPLDFAVLIALEDGTPGEEKGGLL